MRTTTYLPAFVLLAATQGPAAADDSKKDSVTVLPWTQAALMFTSGDKSASIEYLQFFAGGFLFYGKASAPLDEDTRIAAFTSENSVAKGFSTSVQLGIDERAGEFEELGKRAKLVETARKVLTSGSLGQQVPFNEWVAFFDRHSELPSGQTEAIKNWLCDGGRCPSTGGDAAVGRAICMRLGDPACSAIADDEAAKDAAAVASGRYLNANCKTTQKLNSDQLDRCFFARFWLEERGLAAAYDPIKKIVVDKETMELLWKILELIDPEKTKELKKDTGELPQVLVDNIELFLNAHTKLISQRPALARRDLLITGMLGAPKKPTHAFAVAFDFEYDLLAIYQDDLASAEPAKDSKYEWTLAGDYTFYATIPGFAVNVRGGGGRSRDPKAKKAERCTMFPSTDPTVSGKNCDATALFRTGDAPDARPAYFGRLALTYQYGVGRAEDEVIPGVELRGGWEQEDGDDSVNGRLTLFATPVKGTTAARVGVALDVEYAINIGDADSRWNVTPLVFAGATFSQL